MGSEAYGEVRIVCRLVLLFWSADARHRESDTGLKVLGPIFH